MTLVTFFAIDLPTVLSVVRPLLFIIRPIVCDIPTMLYHAKVQKFGILAVMGIIGGISSYLIGHGWTGLPGWILSGILNDVVLKIGGHQKFKVAILSYIYFYLGTVGCPANPWPTGEVCWENIHTSTGDQYINTLQPLMSSWMLHVDLALSFVDGILGVLLGHKTPKKYFKRAGVV